MAPRAVGQISQLQVAEADPDEPPHGVSHALEEAPYLALSTFRQDHGEDPVALLRSHQGRPLRLGGAVSKHHALGEERQRLRRGNPAYVRPVLPLHLAAGVEERVDHVALVGEEEEPFGALVQAPQVLQGSHLRREDVVDRAAAVGV